VLADVKTCVLQQNNAWFSWVSWAAFSRIILETAVGRARVGCWRRVRVGATTPQAHACKAEQRPRVRRQWLNRVRSAITLWVNAIEGGNLSIHLGSKVILSGQLPFLGSSGPGGQLGYWPR
jgi:hypothetical protein